MKNKFTIGQMAKLHNIPIKTLRYYDEIGLFKPIEVDPNTGYRYYSFDQFELLDMIYYLKTLGVPLKEIKQQLEHRDLDAFLKILHKHKELTDTRIKELQLISKKLKHRISEIDRTKSAENIGVPQVMNLKERRIIQMREPIASLADLEHSLRKVKIMLGDAASIVIGKVGLTLRFSQIREKKFSEYNSLFLLLESEEALHFEHVSSVLPAGKYICISYRGSREDAPTYYQMALDFMEKNHLHPNGDAIEQAIVDEFISNKQSDYFVKIQIPII